MVAPGENPVAAGGKKPPGKEEHPMRNQTFGIELETTGIGREATAKAIARYFGTTARYVGAHLGDWHVPMPDGRKWVVERDGSVTDPSAEVVSPVCRWDDLPMVLAVAKAIRAAGAKADSSCGIHVHIGLGEHTPASLRRLVNIVNAKEDLLTQALGIAPYRRERWCAPVAPEFLAALNRANRRRMEAAAALFSGAADGRQGSTETGGQRNAERHLLDCSKRSGLKGNLAIASVPALMLLALLAPRLLRAVAAVVAPVPPLAMGTPEGIPAWKTR